MHISFAGSKLHGLFVDRNKYVQQEYENYLRINRGQGKNKRLMEWLFLLRVNLAYFILNRDSNKESPLRYNGKLPCLDEPESQKHARQEAIHFVHKFLKYDVISFDVFDTLVLRPFSRPADLFFIVGNRLGIMDFVEARIAAEKQAREEHRVKNGNSEVTIYDIYRVLNFTLGLDVDLGVSTELAVELDYCFANPYMKNVWRILLAQKKRLIVTSDMYLPKEMIGKILSKCGFEGCEKIYVSCDYHCSKSSGYLYNIIIYDYGNAQNIVHVGDNYLSDVENPKKIGIDTVYYRNCHLIGTQYRPDDMSLLTGSFYSGIVNTYLHNGDMKYDPYYEFGFIYGGLYIVGFCNWLHKAVKEQGIDKVLFLARDGDIYQKVYKLFFDDSINDYMYWSRISNIKYAIEKQRINFLKNVARYKSVSVIPVTFSDVLKSISLGSLSEKLSVYGIDKNQILTPQNAKELENFLIDNSEAIKNEYSRQEKFAKEYISRAVEGCKKVAVVDVGWKGSGPLGIKYLIEDKWKLGIKVYPFIAGSVASESTEAINEILNGSIRTYMFSRFQNADLFDFHLNTNKGTNCIFFELFTQSKSPSFSGWDENGNMCFDIPEVENYEITGRIHDGIMDFARIYKRFTEKDKYLRNISGRDAYRPFQMIIRDLEYIKKYFGDYSFARGISGKVSNQTIETINMILEKVGV